MPLAVFALAIAAFAIGTTEFIISGILLQVSRDLAISVPVAGLLVSGYAAGVAVGGPVLGLLLTRLPLKPSILGVMLIFALGQVFCALAPNYEMLLLARLISACGHGVFFGVSSVAISQIVPPERRGAAFSLFIGGITVANILGLPGGTAIGNAFGWRVSFLCIAVLALVSVVAVFLTLPGKNGGATEADAPLALQARQVRRPEVWLSYLTIAILMVGQIAFSTFQVAILIEITHIDPITQVPVYLLIGGAGAVIGIWLGGRLADWRIAPSLIGTIMAQAICFAVLLVAVHNAIAMAIVLFLASLSGFAFSTPIQVRILNAAKEAPRLAATFVSTAYNVGISAGALLGAVLLSAGLDFSVLPVAGIVTSILGGLVALVSFRVAPAAAHPVAVN